MYEIKVLSRNEFDHVSKSDPRYSYVDDTNFGFADRLKGKAYIIDTKVHDLNKYLINHELEELEKDKSTHEDPNGIRHKKGPKIFKDILLPLSTGGLFGGKGGGFLSSLFGGGGNQQPQQQQQQQTSGSYDPLQGLADISGGFGGNSLSNIFPTSGSYPASDRLPESVSGSIQPSISLGGNNSQLPPDLLQRLAGTYSGRLVF